MLERNCLKLINDGKCIVAGDRCIWNGGIGNFIKTEECQDAVGCITYNFNLEYFLSSQWYKEVSNLYIAELGDKKRRIELEYDEICSL